MVTQIGKRNGLRSTAIVAAVVAALSVVFVLIIANQPRTTTESAMNPVGAYATGTPGIGETAPGFSLPATDGSTVSLDDYAGKAVLLYFHEGLGCQPCWDQIRDLESAEAQLEAAGIDQLLTITSGPVELIGQKMTDDKLAAIALADTVLDVSRTYQTNQYGMMGDSRNGHSFILVGPDGRIQWRADYGGSPNYTMYVPVDQLLADLEAGRASK